MAVTSNKRYFLAIVLALACNTAQAQMNSLNELEVKSNIATNSPTHTDMDLQGIAPLADTSCKSYVSSPEQDMNSKKRDLAQSDEASIRDSTVSESNQVNEQNCDNDEKFDISKVTLAFLNAFIFIFLTFFGLSTVLFVRALFWQSLKNPSYAGALVDVLFASFCYAPTYPPSSMQQACLLLSSVTTCYLIVSYYWLYRRNAIKWLSGKGCVSKSSIPLEA